MEKLRYLFLKDLATLEIGDIIWAKRYKNEQEKIMFDLNHDEGPFIIIKKTFFRVYGLECTSVPPKFFENFKIQISNITKNKETYVIVNKLYRITKFRFIEKRGHINQDDYINIWQHMALFGFKNNNFIIDVGCIIKYQKKLYYIYDKDDLYFYGIKVNNTKYKNNLNLNNKFYAFTDTYQKIKIKSKYEFINYADQVKQDIIVKLLDLKRKEKINGNSIGYGNLIKFNNQFFYIYGEYKYYYLLYNVYLDNQVKNDMVEIIINNGKYYTNFMESKIKKNKEFKVMRKAKFIETVRIKDKKKEYQTLHKKRQSLKK